MKSCDYELLLDSMRMIGIYVIREDNHEILYFNRKVKQVIKEIATGKSCQGMQGEFCENCPLQYMGDGMKGSVTCHNSPFGNIVDILTTRIQWEEKIPAVMVAVTPHAEQASYTYSKILRCNLDTDRYEIIKITAEDPAPCESLSVWLRQIAASGYIFKEDEERFLEFTDLASIRRELQKGKHMISCIYRRKAGNDFRWYIMEITPCADYAEDHSYVMLYVKDVHDIFREGLEREEINIKNQEIIKSLGELNFEIYMIYLKEGQVNLIRTAQDYGEKQGNGMDQWDQLLQNVLAEKFHPDERESLIRNFSLKALREASQRSGENLEKVFQREIEGSYRYVSIAAHFYAKELGNDYVVLALQNVDERVREQTRRVKADRRMAAIIKSRYSTMNTVHLETGLCERVYLEQNDGANINSVVNYHENYVQEAYENRIYEEDKEAFLAVLSLENLRKKASEVEDYAEEFFQYRIKGKPVTWMEQHLLFIRQEDGVVVNILGRDVTKEKKRAEANEKARQEKAALIDALSGMFFTTCYIDLEQNTFRRVTEEEDEEEEIESILNEETRYDNAIRRYAEKFIHPNDRKDYLERVSRDSLLQSLSKEHPLVAVEYCKVSQEKGEERKAYTRATVALAEMSDGKPKTAIYVAQDITESREKEEREHRALQEACDAANHANASKGEFLSRMSHDIRTPLNAIVGMTAIAENHLEDQDKVADCLNKITAASNHLIALINEVLDMSKIESGQIKLVEEEFNLMDMIQNLQTIMKPSIQKKQQSMEVVVGKLEHENVIGDATRLQQVFINILGNSVKYTANGGKLKVQVNERKSQVAGYGQYEFVFRDNGIGMSQEFLKKIFDPFARAEDSRVSKVEGTGLGMTIVQNIVRMMNGNIEVYSRENEGTQFTVTIFLKQQKKAGGQETSGEPLTTEDAEKKSFAGKRILLVEDNELNREIAEEIIGCTGAFVESVENGEEAVKKFLEKGEEYYDLIFMDVQMPVMNGYEATRSIRQIERSDALSIPIIAMTANAFAEDVQDSKNAGMNEHISKPLSVEQIMKCMEKWLR